MTDQSSDRDRGSGLLGATSGVLVFLLLLGFTVHFMFHLYARSVIRSTTYATARDAVAHVDGTHCERAIATVNVELPNRLGPMGRDAEIHAACDAEVLRVHVSVEPPSMLPTFFGEIGFLGSIDRTVEVRFERLQP